MVWLGLALSEWLFVKWSGLSLGLRGLINGLNH